MEMVVTYRRARQQAAQNIVMGLNEGLGGLDGE